MPYGEEITINVGDAVRIHPNYKNYKFKKLLYGETYLVKELHTDYDKKVKVLETESGFLIRLNMDKRYFEHAGKEKTLERGYNYQLEVGDVVLVSQGGYGLVWEDKEKYVEIIGKGDYFGREGVRVKPYQCNLETLRGGYTEVGVSGVIGYETFGDVPLVLLNTGDSVTEVSVREDDTPIRPKDTYTTDHYNMYYHLTDKDIEAGKIKVDAYWVAKQWKTGSRDDSGALWHSLKTIARFGEKNDKAREIKALYNQAKALARIYDVEL